MATHKACCNRSAKTAICKNSIDVTKVLSKDLGRARFCSLDCLEATVKRQDGWWKKYLTTSMVKDPRVLVVYPEDHKILLGRVSSHLNGKKAIKLTPEDICICVKSQSAYCDANRHWFERN